MKGYSQQMQKLMPPSTTYLREEMTLKSSRISMDSYPRRCETSVGGPVVLFHYPICRLTCLENEAILHVLNAHADVLCSNHKTGTKHFENLFNKFIQAFEKSKFDESYLDGKSTDVTLAYWAFIRCLATEVKISAPAPRQ